jgi:hypothetical protein
LAIQIHGSEQHGRRARDWRSWLDIGELIDPGWFGAVQNPPGAQEGRLRDPSLQALLRELAAFNMGLCVITTRTPVADLSDHDGSSALRRHLEHLSSHAGAQLLRVLGVKGDEAELRSASDQRPLSGSHAFGQLFDRRLPWRHSFSAKRYQLVLLTRATGSPRPSDEILANLVW